MYYLSICAVLFIIVLAGCDYTETNDTEKDSGIFPTEASVSDAQDVTEEMTEVENSLSKSNSSLGTLIYSNTKTLSQGSWWGVYAPTDFYSQGNVYTAVLTPTSGDPDLYLYAWDGSSFRAIRNSLNVGTTVDDNFLLRSDLKNTDLRGYFYVYGYTTSQFTLEIYRKDASESFIFPLSGNFSSSKIHEGSYHHGDHWLNRYCDGHYGEESWRLRHLGSDFSATYGPTVYAAAAGTIKYFATDATWGGYAVIEHTNGNITTYTHVTPNTSSYSVGDWVKAGAVIATLAPGNSYYDPHLHFSIRRGAYDASIALRGRLPNQACTTAAVGAEPAFPEQFVDPETVNWIPD